MTPVEMERVIDDALEGRADFCLSDNDMRRLKIWCMRIKQYRELYKAIENGDDPAAEEARDKVEALFEAEDTIC